MTTPSSDARRRDRSSGVETLVRLLVVLQVITLIALAVLLHRVVSLDGRLDDLSGQISNVGL